MAELLAEDREPWDRQPRESHKAFRAFDAFRMLGAERTIKKAAAALGRTYGGLGAYSSKWRWNERAAAYDRAEARRMREQVLLIREGEAREMATVAKGLWTLAYKDLELWHAKIDRELRRRRDLLVSNPAAAALDIPEPVLSASELHHLAEAGIKLARLIADQPTDIAEQRQQSSADEIRKEIRKHLNNPKVLEAMEQIAAATMPEQREHPLLEGLIIDSELEQ